MHGPMNTMPMSAPKYCRSILQCVSSGDSRPVSSSAPFARWLCRKATTVGTRRRRQHARRIFPEQRRRLRRNLLRAQRRFRHAGKAQFFQRANQLRRRHAGKFRDIRRRERNQHRLFPRQQLPRAGQIVADFFCAIRADLDAMAADDAQLRHHRRVAALDLDGFHRTIAHAFVAILALAFLREDGIQVVHGAVQAQGRGQLVPEVGWSKSKTWGRAVPTPAFAPV